MLRGTADMYVGLAAIHRERDDLAAARSELARSRELGEHAGLPQNAYRWRVAMARVCEAEGDLDAAVGLLDEAERLYEGDFSPDVRPVPALRARAWVRQGRRRGRAGLGRRARAWPSTDDLTYLHEFEHLTLARVLMARHVHELTRSLARRSTSSTGSCARRRTGTGPVRDRGPGDPGAGAPAAGRQGWRAAALERALDLAEPEGYVRTFLDEGAPMAELLAPPRGVGSPYVRRLLAACGAAPAPRVTAATQSALVEPLSNRERDVLRLLGTDLNGPEIARELVVSLNTVRTHTKNLYLKLGVNSRRAALSRARRARSALGSSPPRSPRVVRPAHHVGS